MHSIPSNRFVSLAAGASPGLLGSWLKQLSTQQPFVYAILTVILLFGLGLTLGVIIENVLSRMGYESEKVDHEE